MLGVRLAELDRQPVVEEVRLTYEQWQPRQPDLAVAQRETQHLELRGAYAPGVLSIRWAMEAWQDLAVPDIGPGRACCHGDSFAPEMIDVAI